MESNSSFIFLQETHHLPSSKDIYDGSNRYVTFHASAVDESVHVVRGVGGIVTYVNTNIVETTTIHSSTKSYLATITGNLVCINVYLPQRNLYQNGEYDNAVGDIISIVEELGSSYAYLIVGDFNSSGPNLIAFRRLRDHLDLEDWSRDIEYTFSANVKNGVCSTKLDHVFALNFEVGSIVSCTSAHKFIKQGGHSVIETRAKFPHLSIATSSTEDTNPDRPIYIDYEKTTPCQIEALHREVSEILKPYMDRTIKPSDNIIDIINRVFNQIGSRATFILNQKKFAHPFRHKPGWNKYGISAIQRRIKQVEFDWRVEGRLPASPLANELSNLRSYLQASLSLMNKNEQRSIAEAMTDNITAPTSRDRSRCWKPVRSCIKGNTTSISPIIENCRDQKSIVDFWEKYYMNKLDGLNEPDMNDSWDFMTVAANNSFFFTHL